MLTGNHIAFHLAYSYMKASNSSMVILKWLLDIIKLFYLLLSGIRHPEEMSFCKPLSTDDLKKNYCEKAIKSKKSNTKNGSVAPDTNSYIANKSHNSSNGSLDRSTLNNSHNNTVSHSSYFSDIFFTFWHNAVHWI